MIAAILRAQFLAMRRGFGSGAGLGLLGGILWYALWAGGGCAAFAFAYATPAPRLEGVFSMILGAVFLYWQVVPVISVTMGASLDLRKLLAYPIPHDRLFRIELLLRLVAGIEMLLVLVGAGAGLAVNPSHHGAAEIVAALAVFVAFNVTLTSGVRSLLERLLMRRKIRELMVVVLAALWMVPRFFAQTGFHPKMLDRAFRAGMAVGFPWSAAAHAALGQVRLAAWLSLGVWTLLAVWFGRSQFERSLHFDAAAAQAAGRESPGRAAVTGRFYGLPARFLPDPLAAMVEKELRTLFRAPTFRSLFFMGFTFGLLVWLPMVIGRGSRSDSFLSDHFLTIVSAYALTLLGQVTYWNCFAFDRSAAAFWFIAPQPAGLVLIAKNIASQVPVYLEIAILTAISLPLRLVPGWGEVAEAVAVVGISSVYMLAMGNITSVEYPRGVNPERVGRGGGPKRFQALILIFYPLAILPVALAYLARFAFDSDVAFAVVLALAAAVGGIVYKLSLDAAVAIAEKRREAILRALSEGEGPVLS